MKYIVLICFGLLCGCSPAPVDPSMIETVTAKVMNVDPPKHLYVDLLIESSSRSDSDIVGKVFTRVYVSKHCSAYSGGRRLTDVKVDVVKVVSNGGATINYRFSTVQLYNQLCD